MISVLLPTIRPSHIDRCLMALSSASSDEFQVVVVADFPQPTAYWPLEVTWVEAPRRGPVEAINIAVGAARGEWLFLFNDESVLEPCALDKLMDAAKAEPAAIYSPNHQPPFNFSYYGRPFPPFPFAHRRVFAHVGGLLDPAYRGFYADPDLGMRAHAAGVPIKVVENAVIHHWNQHDTAHFENVAAYLLHDRETFRSRWDHLGEFADP